MKKPALIVVDYQYDFASPQGALSVKGGETIGKTIKQLVDLFRDNGREIIFSGDKHPQGHTSFASTHGVENYTQLNGDTKRPAHCIDGTQGADLYPPLHKEEINIKKAYTKDFDTYSAFGGTTLDETQSLDEYLQSKNITDLYVTGLATDFCVGDTALDSRNPDKVQIPYNTTYISDAAKGVFEKGTEEKIQAMKNAGITIKHSADILNNLYYSYNH